VSVELIEGDCREVLRELADNSIDSVVTDPPYALTSEKKGGTGPASLNLKSPAGRSRVTTGFMGKAWDNGDTAFDPAFWQEVLRVLKPGGHVLSFGGTRTYHRMACAIDDAGFEIRDQIGWIYGSGFPKSSNQDGEWEGWGTALKPAWEPIVVARKPLIGTVAANLAAHGVGALNIDGCRVPTDDSLGGDQSPVTKTKTDGWDRPWMQDEVAKSNHAERVNANVAKAESLGRWPANIIHDGSDEVLAAFPNAPGQLADEGRSAPSAKTSNVFGAMKRQREPSQDDPNEGTVGFKMKPGARRADSGSAARFFKMANFDESELLIWQAKAILETWNLEIANTVDNHSSLSNLAAASALSDVVTLASRGTLQSYPELFTDVTPSELKRISEAVIITILSTGNASLLASPHVKPFLSNVRVNVAEVTGPTATTMITISHWKSDGSAVPVIFKCTLPNTEVGGLVSGKRFAYVPKANKKDRDDGLTTPPKPVVTFATANGTSGKPSSISEGRNTEYRNTHPTVKPTDLMRYLCRLVTPPGGTVLDPFMGSGSTGRGAVLEGFNFIGIEMSSEYMDIADARIAAAEATANSKLQAAE
jgi:DNA modification methylase